MTEVGTPRNQTLIMDQLDGRVNNPKQMNPYLQSTLFNEGLNQTGLFSHVGNQLRPPASCSRRSRKKCRSR